MCRQVTWNNNQSAIDELTLSIYIYIYLYVLHAAGIFTLHG